MGSTIQGIDPNNNLRTVLVDTTGKLQTTTGDVTATSVTISSWNNSGTPIGALTLVGAGFRRLYHWRVGNANAAMVYLQVFNAASTASVTLGTTNPVDIIPIPANSVNDGYMPRSYAYPLGIVIAATTTPKGNTVVTTTLPVQLGVA